MIYLDNGATTLTKPPEVYQAVERTMKEGANPGRGGYGAAMEANRTVFRCREVAAKLFDCNPEEAAITFNCTHGLNIAIRSLISPGDRVVISGFEHNAVVRPLHALRAKITVAGRKLFDWEDTLTQFQKALRSGVDAAVFTHVSNVFGYRLPIEQMAAMCREAGVPFILDAAQSAGCLPVRLHELGAAFIAMPGHKGLMGPQGTGLLLCGRKPEPLLLGGTGSQSLSPDMPEDGPERIEAGTMNLPGIAGLTEGMRYIQRTGMEKIRNKEERLILQAGEILKELGMQVFTGEHQCAALSFVPGEDVETAGETLAKYNIAVRCGLHCAPLAHESAGTIRTGTVRISVGPYSGAVDIGQFLNCAKELPPFYQ